ncbi:MAG: hypothetical protein CL969_05755 [Euryarchaeota archaeon]|nr:hypothetical protein [Euryarchaeota archaeon]MDP6379012.1 Lrp/AsnC family transcriptional regulator [Candidatus Thalassarchaeaceae archaeon]DAC52028.1 MAG TPA: Lrp/AsnC family transcriptional regulator [Candidatus Poseidoniales archaeon]|tara:strand:+ start:167 stop:610 length:444 start_codon:yes stop_codon:yes gene_type:complete
MWKRAVMNIDSTDRALLNGLRDNSRTTIVELAKAAGVSERTVRTRVKKLEEEVIQRYTIIERGIGLSALVRTKLGPGTEVGTLAGEFATWDGVLTCYEVGGGLDADLLLVVSVNDTHALRELLDRIWLTAPDGAVVETHTTLIIEQY